MIRLEAVSKRFPNGHAAVDELSLEVDEGELCVLVGPSGCGKTTTMKMINRLIDPTSGRVLLDGADVAGVDPVALRRRIGYVIQQIGLFPHQTVADNIATVPHLLGWDKKRVAVRVGELLDLVGLPAASFAKRYPSQLSGGERQRVGVARALAADPPVLLMDEPFGAIDPITRSRLQDEFLRLQGEVKKTIVFVTHDVEEAVKLGDRIAVLAEGGVLAQHDTPRRVLADPASPFVADFVGSDRGIKALAVTPIDPTRLLPVPGETRAAADRLAGDVPRVSLGATLADALAAILASDAGWVAVEDQGQMIGTLTPAAIHASVRTTDASPPG
ncbi:MAG TPA: ATP-binding cassette domain-containing protein [Acidimicrobiales bacterium]|nr:ATP-binding cassette domain-containing protein [Acidimicrobiales bacterium]